MVEGGGVLQGQDDGVLAHAPEGGLLVGLANRFRLEVVVLEETTGTLSGGAWTAGLRDGRGRLVGKGGGDHQEPGGAAIVAQFGMAEFGDGPIRESAYAPYSSECDRLWSGLLSSGWKPQAAVPLE